MSDTFAPAQLAAPSSALMAPSVLAPSLDQIDRNFRRVSQLEQATRLPALPDLVKMDLIQSPGADEDSLTEMLLGLDDAYNNRTQQADQLGQAPPSTGVPGPGQGGFDQTRIIIAALSGNKPPSEVTPDAVKQFKLRAINKGLLDMDPARVDNTWSPEFNRLRGEMAFDDYNDQLRGKHPGATTFDRAMGLIGEFASPAGLLHMATELDLFWDFGAIGSEFSTWGDKWRKVGKSKNPLDFGKNLIDALTGPIDDIVFPVINDALLVVGVGGIYNSARVGWMGAELASRGGMLSKLFEGSSRFGRFYDFIGGGVGRNLIEMREPSLIANRLRSFGGIAERGGDALAAWRDLTPVVASKQILQTGMRLGFAGALENRMPGYASDGFSISDLPGGTAVGNSLQNAEMALAGGAMGVLGPNVAGIVGAGVITTGLELMFAPYNIFSPGTFFRHGNEGLGLLSQGGRRVVGALGTTGGRAIAGAGAGALVGAIGGESTAATVEGAVAGAAIGAAAPALGRLLESTRVHQGVTAALLGGGAGLVLGEDPKAAVITGAIAGVGMAYLPSNVRHAIYAQAGIHGLDKLLEGVGQRMVRTSFQMVERDQHLMVGWYQAVRQTLLTEPDRLAQWENDVRSLGVPQAWANWKYAGDVNMASADITWEYSNAAIDWIADRQANAVGGGHDVFQMAEGKLNAQLRPIDLSIDRPIEDLVHDVASRLAWQEHGGVDGDLLKVRDRARRYVEELMEDPEQALRVAEAHNAKAGDTITQLWDPRNFPDATYVPRRLRKDGMDQWAGQSWRDRQDVFTEYVGKHLDRLGGYQKFTAATNDIRMGRAAGLFDDLSLRTATDRFGRQVEVRGRAVPRDPKAVAVNEAIGDTLAGGTVDPRRIPGLDPLSSAHEAGRVTVMRLDELAKHDVRTWSERVADVTETAKYLREAQSKNWSSVLELARMDDEFAAALGGGTVTDRQLVEMARAAVGKGVNKNRTVKKLLAFAKRHNVSAAGLDTTLRKMTDDILNDAAWELHGLGRSVTDESGRQLDGIDALERRLKQLQEKEAQTAAEVDIDGMIARAEATSFDEIDSHDFSWAAEHPIGSPVSPDPGVVARRQAAQEFIDLPDDALVTVYHGTSKANADRLIASRTIDPTMAGSNTGSTLPRAGELYVGGMFESGGYGDTTLAITVRKGDIHPSGEAGDYRDAEWLGEFGADAPVTQGLFLLRNQGAALKDLGDAVDIRIATEGGAVKVKVPKPNSQAAELRQLKDGLEGRGYKLVHGVQFLMPEDLTFNVPTFTDVTRRHMNAVTHGNWFGRRPPVEARILDDRRRRQALAEELSDVGTDLSPEDDKITDILANLEASLRTEQDDVARRLNEAHVQKKPRLTQTLERIGSSFTPVRIDDLGGFRRGGPERVRQALAAMNLSEREEQAVVRAVNNFRNTDFHDMGLFAIENYLRTKSAPAGFLKMLGGTKYGGRVTGRVARQAGTGALIGGTLGAVGAGSDASFEDRLKATLMGGATGAVVGGALSGAVNVADASKGIIQTAEDFRYGYLADFYARLRDSMRFTLSPFFDLSRYTEGMMLSQTAIPLRDARTGERLVVPLNASPAGLRRRIANDLIDKAKADGETLSRVEAKRLAQGRYDRHMNEFQAAARGAKDFDYDAIDSAGQWFRQVGVLGFSPTDWMATAFTSLRGTGMAPEQAYHAAREMYQYGTRGRSAAESSVNFIFFPFSFQKKALTHIGKWLNDDLGRSIMVHDALKTYEVLDEKYDLDSKWREHVPFLQQLGRLNLFAYGLSPGRLGGINSQLLEGAGKVALNAFLPAGVNIRDASAGKELMDLGKQMLPVWNDINWMTRDMQEVVWPELRAGAQRIQGVETPMAMESYRAQVTDGWAEFNAYRTDFESYLTTQGYTTTDVMNDRNDWLAPLKQEYERKVNEIATRYPAWWESKIDAPGNAIALQMEKQNRIVAAEVAVRAGQPPSPDNLQVAQMQAFIDAAQQQVQLVTGSTNLDFAPAQTFDQIKQMAAQFATQNPGFVDLWNKFWSHEFGDLTSPMRLAG